MAGTCTHSSYPRCTLVQQKEGSEECRDIVLRFQYSALSKANRSSLRPLDTEPNNSGQTVSSCSIAEDTVERSVLAL